MNKADKLWTACQIMLKTLTKSRAQVVPPGFRQLFAYVQLLLSTRLCVAEARSFQLLW